MNPFNILANAYKYVYTVYGQTNTLALDVLVQAYVECAGSGAQRFDYPIGNFGVSSTFDPI